jgi:hypothetical protein
VPGAIGMLEAPDNPMPIGIALRIGWAAEGLALFWLVISRLDLPGRWVCLNRRFVLVEE